MRALILMGGSFCVPYFQGGLCVIRLPVSASKAQAEKIWLENHREKKKLAFEQKVKYNITKGQMVRKGI